MRAHYKIIKIFNKTIKWISEDQINTQFKRTKIKTKL
jgi:hypothetical protein